MNSSPPPNLYWDSCVFIAYLNDERDSYGSSIDHIGQYLDEARQGRCKIFCSTITIAEITSNYLNKTNFATFSDFLEDYTSAIVQIGADPNVMVLASQLRSLEYRKGNGKRRLMTPDAIHLATAIILQDTYKVSLTAFHTFDSGKAKGPDGKGVPILGYETWCEAIQGNSVAQKAISLTRTRPEHPAPRMPV